MRIRATQQCVSRYVHGPACLALALARVIVISTCTIRKRSAQSQNRLRHGNKTIVHEDMLASCVQLIRIGMYQHIPCRVWRAIQFQGRSRGRCTGSIQGQKRKQRIQYSNLARWFDQTTSELQAWLPDWVMYHCTFEGGIGYCTKLSYESSGVPHSTEVVPRLLRYKEFLDL
ncbi:hypothetical protein H4582DRAFT_2006039 [Lactarius indigo]|nr:hypothetical protein H4582DRAFT_2006039 [Lactarius indigo]